MTPTYYEVMCEKHGKQEAAIKAYNQKTLAVGTPLNKRQKLHGGCPVCKKEQAESKTN
jgi:hypothetical protein